ncbi:MAG: HAMP domain-containing sensor histidine kinase [Clostridiaceae bacterium]|nr:HAMP domain-containing sensor histidine kinase [Clostridiaceae bacterium]
MIKTLQRKFIITAMVAISVLLVVLVGAINAANYMLVDKQSDRLLDMLTDTQGKPNPKTNPKNKAQPWSFNFQINEDTAMSARYFTVAFDEDGNVIKVDIGRISSVTQEEAREIASELDAASYGTGISDGFKYKISDLRDNSGSLMVFLDMTYQMHSMLMVLGTSALIGVCGWILMLLLVILLSKKAILPIAMSIERQKQFVTNAGHEIKTPLAIIMANTDAMELHNGESKWSRNIRSQTIRLSGLMQDLLTLSKMDEIGTRLPVSEFYLTSLLEEMLTSFAEAAAIQGVEIERDIQQDVTISANRDYIARLVSALLDNAVKYVNKEGRIGVSLKKIGKQVVIKVENTCEKLPEDDPEKLFERFYRGDRARTQKSGGYGIGLSAARAIAEAHKGTVSAEYRDENTIVFTVKI